MEIKLTKEQALDILEKDLECRRDERCVIENRACEDCEYNLSDYIPNVPPSELLEYALEVIINEFKNKNEEKMEEKK